MHAEDVRQRSPVCAPVPVALAALGGLAGHPGEAPQTAFARPRIHHSAESGTSADSSGPQTHPTCSAVHDLSNKHIRSAVHDLSNKRHCLNRSNLIAYETKRTKIETNDVGSNSHCNTMASK